MGLTLAIVLHEETAQLRLESYTLDEDQHRVIETTKGAYDRALLTLFLKYKWFHATKKDGDAGAFRFARGQHPAEVDSLYDAIHNSANANRPFIDCSTTRKE